MSKSKKNPTVKAVPSVSAPIGSLQGLDLQRRLFQRETEGARQGEWGIPARGGYVGGCMGVFTETCQK